MLKPITLLTASLTVALIVVDRVVFAGLMAPTLLITCLLWPAIALGLFWIVKASDLGHWATVQAWLLAGMFRVAACLIAVAMAVKLFDFDAAMTVLSLAVLYLPTLFFETSIVLKAIKRVGDDESTRSTTMETSAQ